MNNAWIVTIVGGLFVAFILFVLRRVFQSNYSIRTTTPTSLNLSATVAKHLNSVTTFPENHPSLFPFVVVVSFFGAALIYETQFELSSGVQRMPQEWRVLYDAIQHSGTNQEAELTRRLTNRKMPTLDSRGTEEFLELFEGTRRLVVFDLIKASQQIGLELEDG